jgi:F-type H+-transporting ATPase subunit b
MSIQIALNPLDMLDALVAVGILYWFLQKYAFPPLLKAVHDRQTRIEEDLAAAERRRTEAEALREQLDAELRQVKARAEVAMSRALREAEDEAQQILTRARQESRRLVEEAEADIASERDAALASVKREVADLALAVAAKVLGQEITAERDQVLFRQVAEQLAGSEGGERGQ